MVYHAEDFVCEVSCVGDLEMRISIGRHRNRLVERKDTVSVSEAGRYDLLALDETASWVFGETVRIAQRKDCMSEICRRGNLSQSRI